MPRPKFQTLTQSMYYVLLCLQEERCGQEIMAQVQSLTGEAVSLGPGTLYNLLEQFSEAGMIRQTRVEGRRLYYRLTPAGREALEAEVARLRRQLADYERCQKAAEEGN